MSNNSLVIAADIGGSHITAAAVDLNRKEIGLGSRVRLAVDAAAAPGRIIEQWARAVEHAAGNRRVSRLSLALPGPFDYQKGICLIKAQHKYESLYGQNVKELMAAKLDIDPANIFLTNDAAAFLRGEVFAGAAQACRSAVGLTLGTGLGTACYCDGDCRDAGRWNMPFHDAIAEEYLSTRWFVRRFQILTGKDLPGVRNLLEHPDPAVTMALFNEFGTNLYQFLLAWLEKDGLSPEFLVIGGNIAKAFNYFKHKLAPLRLLYPQLSIRASGLGEDAAIFGAAACFADSNFLNIS